MHVLRTRTLQFPRVVLELDGDSLDLSDECKEDLKAISTKEGATKERVQFLRRKYGTSPKSYLIAPAGTLNMYRNFLCIPS